MNKACAILFTLLLGISSSALANNNLFLPGDALFHTLLTEKKLKALENEANPRFDYFRNVSFGSGCGFAGYSKLEFTRMPKSFRENVVTACREVLRRRAANAARKKKDPTPDASDRSDDEIIDDDIPRDPTTVNVMFYNLSFDIKRYRFGLRYNENWSKDIESFGHGDRAQLDPLFYDVGALAAQWRDAKKVDALQAVCPKLPSPLPRTTLFSFKLDPVRVAKNIRVIVLESPDMRQYFYGNTKLGYYDVTKDGVTRYHWVNGEWAVDADFSTKDKSKR